MRFSGKTFLLVASLVLGIASTASAQDGMKFDAEDVEAAAPVGPSPVAAQLAEGKRLYQEEKYYEAAQKFHEVLQDQNPASSIDRNEAQYQMAKTLFHLGLYQSALDYYRAVTDFGETHPFFLPALNGLVELTEVVGEDAGLTERLLVYRNYYPNDVPKKYRDRFAYLVGRSLDQTDPEAAIALLSAVSPNSPDYAKAQYIAGVANVSIYNAAEAAKNFKASLRALTAKRERKGLDEEEKRLLELGYLALARVFYSTGQYDSSVKYYSRIDRNSENWPVALFESSWAYFQLDNYNQALGNLQSLNSPFFSDRYFPEGPILAAVLYFYNCRYDRVRGILDDFAYEYEPLQKSVQKLIDKFSANFDSAYRWLINARVNGAKNKDLQRVVSAALTDKQLRQKLLILASLDQEIKKFDKLPKDFQSSPTGVAFKESLEADRTNIKFDIGELTVARLDRVNRELQDLIIEEKKILFEVDRSERGEIEADLKAGLTQAAEKTKTYDMKTTDEQLVWTFDGEYWRDELGYYVVTTASQCKR